MDKTLPTPCLSLISGKGQLSTGRGEPALHHLVSSWTSSILATISQSDVSDGHPAFCPRILDEHHMPLQPRRHSLIWMPPAAGAYADPLNDRTGSNT